MQFTLSPKEQEALAEFKAKVLKKYKKKDKPISFTIMFTTTAIGNVVEVKSSASDEIKDITDYNTW